MDVNKKPGTTNDATHAEAWPVGVFPTHAASGWYQWRTVVEHGHLEQVSERLCREIAWRDSPTGKLGMRVAALEAECARQAKGLAGCLDHIGVPVEDRHDFVARAVEDFDAREARLLDDDDDDDGDGDKNILSLTEALDEDEEAARNRIVEILEDVVAQARRGEIHEFCVVINRPGQRTASRSYIRNEATLAFAHQFQAHLLMNKIIARTRMEEDDTDA